ncbi:MAG: SRPBCC domain-containing protein [Solirubrobacteraceae bacterium]|nr:SRPBCC domain-containing protein [Solirubrobacteraceae bacterium]
MPAQVDATASTVIDATAEEVWHLVSDGRRIVAWWPKAERAEDVQGGRFTLVLRSSRGVPVRLDWRIVEARRPRLLQLEQDIAGTPFERALSHSRVEIALEATDDGRCRASLTVDRGLQQRGVGVKLLGRRASRRHARELLDRLAHVAAAGDDDA